MKVGAIHADAASTAGAAVSPRLVKAAHEFEGQMMKELLKPMVGSDALPGGDNDADAASGSGGALGEFAAESLGQALSQRGGFGIADCIFKDLSHRNSPNSVTCAELGK